MNRTVIFAILLKLCLCFKKAEWLDKCQGNILNANANSGGKQVGIEQHVHHYTDTKKIWEDCAYCISTGKNRYVYFIFINKH